MCLSDPVPENSYECKYNAFPDMANIHTAIYWLSYISDYSFGDNTGLMLEATNFIAMDYFMVMFLFS